MKSEAPPPAPPAHSKGAPRFALRARRHRGSMRSTRHRRTPIGENAGANSPMASYSPTRVNWALFDRSSIMSDIEEAIRGRAYELWEHAGRPEGQSDEFWHAARLELGAKETIEGKIDA